MTTRATAVTMWDFSWLLRRQGAEAEYADVDAVLDQLADRGYDTVRIDAFPHWIAADPTGRRADTITALPQPPGFMWGNHSPVDVQPLPALLEFLTGLAARGLTAGLSTWFTPDTGHRAAQVDSPEQLGRVWCETLDHIAAAGLLDTVAYVDLCNEWPGWAPGVRDTILGADHDPAAPPEPFTDDQLARLDTFRRSLQMVKARAPRIPVTFSYFLRGPRPPLSTDMMRLDTSEYGLAEPHLWLSSGCPAFIDRFAYHDTYSSDVTNLTGHEHLVHDRWAAERSTHLAELAELMDTWAAWAEQRHLLLWTTEGWASIGWSPDLIPGWDGWDYIRDVAEAAVDLATARGWTGICTSNFSQPHHTGMWADPAWHRRVTAAIHGEHHATAPAAGRS